MTLQEIVNKISELRAAAWTEMGIFLELKTLYPNVPDIKLKGLMGGTV